MEGKKAELPDSGKEFVSKMQEERNASNGK